MHVQTFCLSNTWDDAYWRFSDVGEATGVTKLSWRCDRVWLRRTQSNFESKGSWETKLTFLDKIIRLRPEDGGTRWSCHPVSLISKLGMILGWLGFMSVCTEVKCCDFEQASTDRELLGPVLSEWFRRLSALTDVMIQDRVDVCFAAKDIWKTIDITAVCDVVV